MPIRVLLVDDHKIIRDGLISLLQKQPDIEVVGEADNGRDAVRLAHELRPEIVVMDIGMPELNGIDATHRLRAECPDAKIIALSMHSNRRHASAMLAAGAQGYVLKDSAFEELVAAIRSVSHDRVFLSERIAGVVVEDLVRRMDQNGDAGGPASELSTREREVLQLIGEGYSTKEIAARLHLSVKTVETHRRQIMTKLDIFNVPGLVKYAMREGLVSLDD
jgi:DNA-binding NarL/FixJ family response regulator